MKVQKTKKLFAEMRAVARGEAKAPADAASPSVESAEALIRLLTPENRQLLCAIRDRKPQSVSDLAKLTSRAEPNLLRTLGKLEALGFLEMQTVGRRKLPVLKIKKLRLEIDPFGMLDRIEFVPGAR